MKNKKVLSVYKPIEFPIVNNEELALKLDVITSAKQLARNNLPAMDAIRVDSNELNFKEKIKVRALRAVHVVNQSISDLRDQIQALSVSSEISDINEMSNEFNRKVSADFAPVLQELSVLKRELHLAEDDINNFKKKHGLLREADYPITNWGTAGVLFIALIIEATLNGTFFAEGSDAGLLGGIWYALIIALINISFGFILGWWALRYINYRFVLVKITAVTLSSLFLLIPIMFNLLMSHLREALILDPDNATKVAMHSFSEGMLSIYDVNSWLLFFVGMIFCLLAIYKGYRFDDEYPGYGKLARRKDNLEDEIQDERHEALQQLEGLHSEYLNSLEKKFEQVEQKGKQFNSFSSAFDHQNRILRAYIEHLEGALQYIIKLYRDTNTAERKDAVPDYFNAPFDTKLVVDGLDIAYIDRRYSMTTERDKLAELIPEVRSNLLSIKENCHKKIDEICQS